MRRRRHGRPRHPGRRGLTSTCVEKTWRKPVDARDLEGEPPRARRRHSWGAICTPWDWRTSTRVEKTSRRSSVAAPSQGEPPRGWRRLLGVLAHEVGHRRTSTRVEKTPTRRRRATSPREYLHAGGEDVGVLAHVLSPPGGPPRAWRRPPTITDEVRGSRLTSTCVEKTLESPNGRATSRGEPPRAWRRR